MPTYTPDTDFVAGTTTPLSVARLNQDFGVNGNIAYLFNRPNFVIIYNKGADWTGTNTAFADVDAVNLTATVTIASTRFLVVAMGQFLTSANTHELDVAANGVKCGGTHGLLGTVATTALPFCLIAPFTGLTPGAITFRLQNRVSAAATWTLKGVISPIVMFGLEW